VSAVLALRKATVEAPWDSLLHNIEERVRGGDRAGIRARWESGHHILKRRQGKQLPKGLLFQLCRALGVSQQELSRRVVFAEAYPSESELTQALSKFATWNQIVTKGLRPRSRGAM